MLSLGLGLGICDSANRGGFNARLAASLPAAWWKMGDPNTATGGQFAHGVLDLPGAAGYYASTPDSVALSITGDIDIRVFGTFTATATHLAAKWSATAGQGSWILSKGSTGFLQLFWSADGTTALSAVSTVAFTLGTSLWVRATLDVDNGATGRSVKFYTSPDGVVWTQLGTTVTTAGVTSIFDSTAVQEVGASRAGTVSPSNDAFCRVQIRNNILDDGTGIVFDADFTSRPIGTTTVTESSVNAATVTVAGPVVADYSATFAYDAQAKNGAAFGATGAVGSDLAMTFDGVNDYIQANAGTLISGQAALSVFGYIKTTSTGKTLLYSQGATKRVKFGIASHLLQAVFNDGTTTDTLAGTVIVDDGVWHEVGFVVSGGKCQLYVDGVADGTNQTITSTIGTPESSTPILFFDNSATYYAGSAQHWRVYQRSLLAAEVFALWSAASVPQTAVLLTNEEASTLTNIQVMLHLDANNFDWSKTLSDGSDLRVYAADGVTAVQFWIAAWDTTLKVGHVVLLVPSLPAGSTTFYLRGNGTSAALSSYGSTMVRFTADADVYAQYRFGEGSGTSLASSVGSFTAGVTNATWVSGDGGAFGDRLVAPRFAGGSHLTFNGSTQYAFIPGLMTDAGLANGTISFWMEALATTASGQVILEINRYGTLCLQLEYVNSNRIQLTIFDVDGGSVVLQDIPGILGDFGVTSGWRQFITLSWGAAGASLWIDGQIQNYDTTYVKAPKTIAQIIDGSTGLPTAGVSIGAHYDPRVGDTNGFAPIRIDGLTIHSRQLVKHEIDQLRHRTKLHTVTTAYERLAWQGIAVDHATYGTGFNSGSFQEASVTQVGAKLVMFVRAGDVGTDSDANGCRTCRLESTDGTNWSNFTQVLGMGNGGYAASTTGPDPFVDPVTGAFYLFYSGATVTGSLFGDLRYATSPDSGITFVDQGTVNLHGFGVGGPSANHDMLYLGGRYHLLAEFDIVRWKCNYWTGPTPTNMDTAVATPIVNGALSDEGTFGGPDIHVLADGGMAVLLHSNVPSVIFLRTGVSLNALKWGFYDNVILIRQGNITGIVNQAADPCAVEFNGSTFVYMDHLVNGSTPGNIGVYSYAGSFSNLVRHSVRAKGSSAKR